MQTGTTSAPPLGDNPCRCTAFERQKCRPGAGAVDANCLRAQLPAKRSAQPAIPDSAKA